MRSQHPLPPPAASLALAFLLLAPPAAAAQAGGRPSRGHRPMRPADIRGPRAPSIRERSIIMREMERRAGEAPPPETTRLAMAQIAEDYEQLQVVNNRMMRAVIPAPAPDYRLIAQATADIRKRAERLRANLALPRPEGEAGDRAARPPAADAAQMKEALLALDRVVMSFVKSPLFKNTDVVEAGAAVRAGLDLEEVIRLSRRAAKDAERLGARRPGP